MNASTLVQKLWNYWNVLRDDGHELWRLPREAHRPAPRRWPTSEFGRCGPHNEMSNPFSLRIFVADSDPDGLRVSRARIFLRHLQCAIRAMYTKVISPFDKPAQAKR
jgi:hypothetical protein